MPIDKLRGTVETTKKLAPFNRNLIELDKRLYFSGRCWCRAPFFLLKYDEEEENDKFFTA